MKPKRTTDGDVPTLMVRITLSTDGIQTSVDWDPTSGHAERVKVAAALAASILEDFFDGSLPALGLAAMVIRSGTTKESILEQPTCGHAECEAAYAEQERARRKLAHATRPEHAPAKGLDTTALDAARKKAGF